MKVYFRDVGNWRGHHWSCKKKYRIFWVILLLFIIFSGYYLLPEKSTDHDLGFASLELSQKESTKGNIIRIDFVNKDGEITYAIDRRYATLLRTKNEDGQIIQDQYLDENGMPTNCYGYYKIKYTYNGNKKIIIFQDSDGKPANLESGYSSIIRTFNKNGQIIQDLYFDSEMNAVPSVGGYYGIYRKYNSQGLNYESIYINAEGFPMTNTSGYAKEQYIFDENNCKIKQFYFDVNSKPVQSILGQYGEEYKYDNNGRISQITYLNKDGKPTSTNLGYTILKRNYYKDGAVKSDRYFDIEGKPVALSKGQYGIKHIGIVTLYLNKNGKIKCCIDNLLNGYPFMTVIIGLVLSMMICFLPRRLQSGMLISYIIFIIYETLMFREQGNIRSNLKLFSYAQTFLTDQRIRKDVINNIWLFVPFGAGFYTIFRKKRVWIVSLLLSILIESIQYFTGLGIAELDDIFGNTFGGIIGVLIAYGLLNRRKRKILRKGSVLIED